MFCAREHVPSIEQGQGADVYETRLVCVLIFFWQLSAKRRVCYKGSPKRKSKGCAQVTNRSVQRPLTLAVVIMVEIIYPRVTVLHTERFTNDLLGASQMTTM